MRKTRFGRAGMVAASLVLAATSPAQAYSGSCSASATAGSNYCSSWYSCKVGERVSISVSGLAASGTASCNGATASCSTGLSLSCSATSWNTANGANAGDLYCTVSGYGASMHCSSS